MDACPLGVTVSAIGVRVGIDSDQTVASCNVVAWIAAETVTVRGVESLTERVDARTEPIHKDEP